jgi:hypothetical protein
MRKALVAPVTLKPEVPDSRTPETRTLLPFGVVMVKRPPTSCVSEPLVPLPAPTMETPFETVSVEFHVQVPPGIMIVSPSAALPMAADTSDSAQLGALMVAERAGPANDRTRRQARVLMRKAWHNAPCHGSQNLSPVSDLACYAPLPAVSMRAACAVRKNEQRGTSGALGGRGRIRRGA